MPVYDVWMQKEERTGTSSLRPTALPSLICGAAGAKVAALACVAVDRAIATLPHVASSIARRPVVFASPSSPLFALAQDREGRRKKR